MYGIGSKHVVQTALNKVIISVVTEVSQYQIKGVREHRTGYKQLKRLENKKKKIMNLRIVRKTIKK